MTLTLYNYRRCPYCIRVRMVLLYKGIKFELKEEKLRDWSDEFLKIRQFKPAVPVLVHDETVIVESAIIMQYLEDLYPEKSLDAHTPLTKAQMRLWIHWAQTEFVHHIHRYKYGESADEKEEGREGVHSMLQKIEDSLSTFLVEQKLTLADFGVWPFVRQAIRVNPERDLFEAFPKTKKWYESIESLPELKEVMKK